MIVDCSAGQIARIAKIAGIAKILEDASAALRVMGQFGFPQVSREILSLSS
jgi:hypothetical protein